MDKSLKSLASELSRIRTGRAHPALLEHLRVAHYGSEVPLNQVASITVEEYRTLVLSVWEKGMVKAVEKSIADSDLGLNPVVKGTVVRVPMPALTEERRRELIKLVRQQGEAAKVAVRNIRRDTIKHLKEAVKSAQISEDEEKSSQTRVDKITAGKIKEIDSMLDAKEQELVSID